MSSNTNVATINSSSGKITAKKAGTAVITVSDGEKSGTYTLNGTTYTSGAKGIADHSEGYKCLTESGRQGNHAEGYQTRATGGAAHSEGDSTLASGQASHAEGIGGTYTLSGTTYTCGAKGTSDHVEGYQCLTEQNMPGNHAEGYQTRATGGGAHSEGQGTFASGFVSHAEGEYTTASGAYSHAEGNYTTASADSVVSSVAASSPPPPHALNAIIVKSIVNIIPSTVNFFFMIVSFLYVTLISLSNE